MEYHCVVFSYLFCTGEAAELKKRTAESFFFEFSLNMAHLKRETCVKPNHLKSEVMLTLN